MADLSISYPSIIEDAMGYAFPYIREDMVAPGSLARHIRALQEELLDHISMTAPEEASLPGPDITITLAGNLAGYPLLPVTNGTTSGAVNSYTDFRYMDNQGTVWSQRITIVPESHFYSPERHPAGIVRMNSAGKMCFFPCDPSEKNWSDASAGPRFFFIGNGDKILWRYVPISAGAPFTIDQTTLFTVQASAITWIGLSVALQILLGNPSTPPVVIQAMAARVETHKGLMLQMLSKRSNTSSTFNQG